MSTNINFGKKLGITGGSGISLPSSSTPPFEDTTSLLYDGIDMYQETTSWSTLDGANEFTISLWVKIDSLVGTNRLLGGYEIGTASNLYMNVYSNGQMQCWSGGSGSNYTRTNVGAITSGIWHHIVFRLLPTSVEPDRYSRQRIFIDGVVNHNSSNYSNGPIPNGTTLGIGANYNNSNIAFLYPTNGNINEVAIWDSYLTDAQILEVYNNGSANDLKTLPTAPVPTNWYRSENANWLGGYYETTDEMGNGAKLSSRNMVEASRVNDVPPTFSKLSTLFDGVDDFVSMGNVLNMADNGTDAFSMSLWFKTSTNGIQQLIGKSATNGYNIYMQSGIIYFGFGTFGSNGIWGRGSIGTPLYNGTWHHLTLTYDGSQDISGFSMYFNNTAKVILTSQNTTPSGVSTTNHFVIGARGNTGTASLEFSGNIDEASFFNTELSASDVNTIYNNGIPNDISGISGLVSFWRMGDNDTYPTINDVIGTNDGTMNNMSSANFVPDIP